jgi:hypothetical protein
LFFSINSRNLSQKSEKELTYKGNNIFPLIFSVSSNFSMKLAILESKKREGTALITVTGIGQELNL